MQQETRNAITLMAGIEFYLDRIGEHETIGDVLDADDADRSGARDLIRKAMDRASARTVLESIRESLVNQAMDDRGDSRQAISVRMATPSEEVEMEIARQSRRSAKKSAKRSAKKSAKKAAKRSSKKASASKPASEKRQYRNIPELTLARMSKTNGVGDADDIRNTLGVSKATMTKAFEKLTAQGKVTGSWPTFHLAE